MLFSGFEFTDLGVECKFCT